MKDEKFDVRNSGYGWTASQEVEQLGFAIVGWGSRPELAIRDCKNQIRGRVRSQVRRQLCHLDMQRA